MATRTCVQLLNEQKKRRNFPTHKNQDALIIYFKRKVIGNQLLQLVVE